MADDGGGKKVVVEKYVHVKQLKEKLAMEMKIPIKDMQLVYDNIVLEDEELLAHYNVTSEKTIHVVVLDDDTRHNTDPIEIVKTAVELEELVHTDPTRALQACDAVVAKQWDEMSYNELIEMFRYRQQHVYGRRPVNAPRKLNLNNGEINDKWNAWGEVAEMSRETALLRYGQMVEKVLGLKLHPEEEEESDLPWGQDPRVHENVGVCARGWRAIFGRVLGQQDTASAGEHGTGHGEEEKADASLTASNGNTGGGGGGGGEGHQRRVVGVDALRLDKAVMGTLALSPQARAALKMQAIFRGRRARQKYMLLCAVMLLQRAIRARRLRKQLAQKRAAENFAFLREFTSALAVGLAATTYALDGAATETSLYFSEDRTNVIVAHMKVPLTTAKSMAKQGSAVVIDTSSLLDVQEGCGSQAFQHALAVRRSNGDMLPDPSACMTIVSSQGSLNLETRVNTVYRQLSHGFRLLITRRLNLIHDKRDVTHRRVMKTQGMDPLVYEVTFPHKVSVGIGLDHGGGMRTVVVSSVNPDIPVGSELLAINDTLVSDKPHLEAVAMLKTIKWPLTLRLYRPMEHSFNRMEVSLKLDRGQLGAVKMYPARLAMAAALERLLAGGVDVDKVYPDKKAVARRLWMGGVGSDTRLYVSRPRQVGGRGEKAAAKGVFVSDISAVLGGNAYRGLDRLEEEGDEMTSISVVSSERLMVFQVQDAAVRASLLTLLVNYCSLAVLEPPDGGGDAAATTSTPGGGGRGGHK